MALPGGRCPSSQHRGSHAGGAKDVSVAPWRGAWRAGLKEWNFKAIEGDFTGVRRGALQRAVGLGRGEGQGV